MLLAFYDVVVFGTIPALLFGLPSLLLKLYPRLAIEAELRRLQTARRRRDRQIEKAQRRRRRRA